MYIVHFCYNIYNAFVCVIDLLVVLLLQHFHTALDLAHDHGQHQVAEFLLSKGAKVNRCNKVSMYIQNSNMVYFTSRAVKT